MSQIHLPDTLLQQIEAAGVTGAAVDAFVEQAVREKLTIAHLSAAERRRRFFELSDEMRAAMHEQGLSEQELLAEFDALCDGADICAPGSHLTRDQLHERSRCSG